MSHLDVVCYAPRCQITMPSVRASQDELMKTDTDLPGGMKTTILFFKSPDPISPGRTGLHPSDCLGVDQLPKKWRGCCSQNWSQSTRSRKPPLM